MSLDLVFLLHTAVEGIFGLQLIFFPKTIFFLSIADDYAQFIAGGYGAALIGSAVTSAFAFGLPSMLPCKRAAALGFMVYHALFSLFAFQTRTQGPLKTSEAWTLTIAHLTLFFLFYTWYKITGEQVRKYIKQNKDKSSSSH
ncbi:unnamed protein product [Cunninghamella echinulata]